jgi:predicted MPP superfamily phosphohydrolase
LVNGLAITEYTIHSGKIKTKIKIVLLTDLHSCSYGKSQSQLIDTINKQDPDVIMMSGDIADDVLPDDRVRKLLNCIAHKYPCYYVTGNHEFWSNRADEQKEMFRSYGVNVLEGTSDTISLDGQEISICGVDDPDGSIEKFESQLNSVAKIVTDSKYTILLSHRPELFAQYVEHNFDLVLSGHAHGGQWRIPLLLQNGLYAPDQGLFPKHTHGVYEQSNTKMLVSRGLSRESTLIPRFYNRPELVVINLEP